MCHISTKFWWKVMMTRWTKYFFLYFYIFDEGFWRKPNLFHHNFFHINVNQTLQWLGGLKAQDECYQSLENHVRIQQYLTFFLFNLSFTVHFHLSSHVYKHKWAAFRCVRWPKILSFSWIILTSLHGLTLTASFDKTMQNLQRSLWIYFWHAD